MVDTTKVATDTIDYVATDMNRVSATSTRTVIIEASALPLVLDYTASTTVPGASSSLVTVASTARNEP